MIMGAGCLIAIMTDPASLYHLKLPSEDINSYFISLKQTITLRDQGWGSRVGAQINKVRNI